MVNNIFDKNITKGLDTVDLVGGMLLKPVAEVALSKVVGNGTLVSGLAKLGIAYASNKYIGGTIGNIVAVGVGVDGAEDVAIQAATKLGIKAASPQSEGVF